jgi:RNA polymerase sigma-70 factor (ECF subfamily)
MDQWPDIVRQYSPLVRKTAYRLLGNHADAADCVQEVFISALKSYPFNEVDNWLGLLRRMTVCRAVDMLRDRFRRTARSIEPGDGTAVPCPHAGPAQSAEDRDLAIRLRQLIAQLPPQQAEVFSLICIEELSCEEAATHLGTTCGNVRVLLHRARAKLRELLAASQTPAEG